jgi:hypothetical protein
MITIATHTKVRLFGITTRECQRHQADHLCVRKSTPWKSSPFLRFAMLFRDLSAGSA